jgi:hypothetical protein
MLKINVFPRSYMNLQNGDTSTYPNLKRTWETLRKCNSNVVFTKSYLMYYKECNVYNSGVGCDEVCDPAWASFAFNVVFVYFV